MYIPVVRAMHDTLKTHQGRPAQAAKASESGSESLLVSEGG